MWEQQLSLSNSPLHCSCEGEGCCPCECFRLKQRPPELKSLSVIRDRIESSMGLVWMEHRQHAPTRGWFWLPCGPPPAPSTESTAPSPGLSGGTAQCEAQPYLIFQLTRSENKSIVHIMCRTNIVASWERLFIYTCLGLLLNRTLNPFPCND